MTVICKLSVPSGTDRNCIIKGRITNYKTIGDELKQLITVESRFTDTRLIATHRYYGQFSLSLRKESPYVFS